jgi:hypothetical protein
MIDRPDRGPSESVLQQRGPGAHLPKRQGCGRRRSTEMSGIDSRVVAWSPRMDLRLPDSHSNGDACHVTPCASARLAQMLLHCRPRAQSAGRRAHKARSAAREGSLPRGSGVRYAARKTEPQAWPAQSRVVTPCQGRSGTTELPRAGGCQPWGRVRLTPALHQIKLHVNGLCVACAGGLVVGGACTDRHNP